MKPKHLHINPPRSFFCLRASLRSRALSVLATPAISDQCPGSRAPVPAKDWAAATCFTHCRVLFALLHLIPSLRSLAACYRSPPGLLQLRYLIDGLNPPRGEYDIIRGSSRFADPVATRYPETTAAD
jgi:hypothetical protein